MNLENILLQFVMLSTLSFLFVIAIYKSWEADRNKKRGGRFSQSQILTLQTSPQYSELKERFCRVGEAETYVSQSDLQFTQTRHGVTMGGQTGTNFNGVVRNVTVTNCTSESADTAHYDTHQACEGIVFSSNTAWLGYQTPFLVGITIGVFF